MKAGDIVHVFQKPLTGEFFEGHGRLVENVKPDNGDGLSIWMVEFLDEPGEQYQRTVYAKNAVAA